MQKGQPAPGEVNRPLLLAKMLIIILSVFFGVVGFIIFIRKQNPNAAGSCIMLAIVSAMYLRFHSAVLKMTLQQSFSRTSLKVVFILSFVIGVIEFLSALSYITLATLEKQEFRLEGRSLYVASIPAAAAALLAPFLAYDSKAAMALFPDANAGVGVVSYVA